MKTSDINIGEESVDIIIPSATTPQPSDNIVTNERQFFAMVEYSTLGYMQEKPKYYGPLLHVVRAASEQDAYEKIQRYYNEIQTEQYCIYYSGRSIEFAVEI